MKLFLILKQPQFFKQDVLLLMKIIVMVYNAVSLGGFAYNAIYTYEIFISNNAKRTQNVKSNPYYPFNIKANLNCH